MKEKLFFKKGTLIGELKSTLVESYSATPNAKNGWYEKFALLDNNGKWLISKYWNLNQKNKAIKEITEIFEYVPYSSEGVI